MRNETILNVFPSDDLRGRLVIAIQSCPAAALCGSDQCGLTPSSLTPNQPPAKNKLVLRQETFSDDIGWFVQSCVAIEPEQLPGLKMALTSNATRKLHPPATEIHRPAAILKFDRAAAANVG